MAGERQRAKKGDQVEQPPTPDVAEPQRPAPVVAPPVPEEGQEAEAVAPTSGPLVAEDDDSAGRTKVPRDYLLSRSERLLGIPRHELDGALIATDNNDDELTLNAARKAHEQFIGAATTAEEG